MKINTEMAQELWFKMYSLQMICDEIGGTRAGVKKALNRVGVDTSREATSHLIECRKCGEGFKVCRARARNAERGLYCSKDCYYQDLRDKSTYVPDRQGQRIARAVVSQYQELRFGEVVHHIDGDCCNNDLSNLMVFVGNGDHVRHHRLIA